MCDANGDDLGVFAMLPWVYSWPATNMFLRDPKFQHNTWLVAHANSPLERFLLVPKGCVSSMLQPQLSMWSALPSGGLKINVDVPVTEDLPYFRVGVVA